MNIKFTLALLLAGSHTAHAQTAGSLDPAFYGDAGGCIAGTAMQPDGKILVVGGYDDVGDFACATRIARFNPNGTPDIKFTAVAVNDAIYSVVLQADGKILLGGKFNTVGGQTRNKVARLNADGSLDSSFSSGVVNSDLARCVALQADGKILVGGANGSGITRLNADGTLDSSFNRATSSVYNVTVQPNGRILLCGPFTSFDGQIRNHIARLNADGTLDSSFNPEGTFYDVVYTVALQPDGKILLGGQFHPQTPFSEIVRLNPNGSRDASFSPVLCTGYDVVHSIALQADGKILFGGRFVYAHGQFRNGIGRLNANGSLDSNFNPGGTHSIVSVASQADGKVLLAGRFGYVDGQPRASIARLFNDAAVQTLTIPDNTRLLWTRGGSAPEVEQVTFDFSLDGGVNWIPLGPGTRVPGGWERPVTNFPATSSIRARGRTSGGEYNGSSGIVEQNVNVSDIAVLDSAGSDLADGGSTINFGPVVFGSTGSRQFTIRNAGTGNLTGLAVSLAGGNPGDFTAGAPGAPTLVPGASTTFTAGFSPTAAGTRTATLQVASNDPDENPFVINLTGTQATASEAWRQLYFGSPYNTGAGEDLNDPDNDGIVNLMEFATMSDPLGKTPSIGELVKNGNTLEFTYTRPKAAVAEVSYIREYSESLAAPWLNFGGSAVTILTDDGVTQRVRQNTPAGAVGKRFVRLRVTRL